jgi:hypothetical protein
MFGGGASITGIGLNRGENIYMRNHYCCCSNPPFFLWEFFNGYMIYLFKTLITSCVSNGIFELLFVNEWLLRTCNLLKN